MMAIKRPDPRMQLDLALAFILTLLAFVTIVLALPIIVRLPLVAVLVLFIPGFALLSALIVESALTVLERVMIAIVASICVTITCGLALALLGIPIDSMNWAYALTAISVVGLLVAWFRRWRGGVAGPHPTLARSEWRKTALVVIAVLMVADIFAVSSIVASYQFGSPPEQLWMIEGDNPFTAELGMRAGPVGGDYRIVVTSNADVLYEYAISLSPSEAWHTPLSFTPEQRTQPIEASLYQAGSQIEERSVSLQALPSNDP